ncbi:D-alanyl-D-alanine carboxypeptidase family protein [Candidatus Wolfebacteria bacterium]|nr:D-alanyl-D-alanine carboxypeptidase family protein [Candidatus Wolfebacteria bacterium]
MKIIFTAEDKKLGASLFKKVHSLVADGGDYPIMDAKDFGIHFSAKEVAFLKKILNFQPVDFGLGNEFFGIGHVRRHLLVKIENQEYEFDGKVKIIKPQFLPANVFEKFVEMNRAMETDIARRLNVYSGYRSPAYQALTFFHVLHSNSWNLEKTLKRVALSGCSEHGNIKKQGVDFAPVEGIASLNDFDKTSEYKWMLKKARRFGFYLSYPKNNKKGIDYEPWHWHFEEN